MEETLIQKEQIISSRFYSETKKIRTAFTTIILLFLVASALTLMASVKLSSEYSYLSTL